ncbi:hypothetical protein Tco_0949352, partial [Tanacetum coccineum]
MIETWDDIQAKIDADHQLAERLQAQEQEELSDAEKATLFVQLLEKRRKHFAAKRTEEKRNKPPTKAQQRKIMCYYLKNMEGYKLKDLKLKEFDSIQEMFDKAFRRVDDDKETTELKHFMEVILDKEEVAIDAIPLAVKSPKIVDWKIYKEGKKRYYQIIRADRKSQMYMVFSQMLKSFDREDLYKLVKAKYKSTRPVEREKHSRARLEIQGYELALESLESRILRHEKNELAWGEKHEFQNYELKCRELKINNLNMELEKVVKERDELNIKIAKWEESSKSLNILLNSQMSAHDKNGLGYGTQLNEMSDKSETDSEISMSVFEVRSSDEESTPANDRFSKADGYHVVPPLITGNFLTLRADISFAGLDEYAIRKKIIESKTIELNTNTSKSKTSETVAKTQVDKIGQTSKKAGIGFKKIKSCFVYKSTDHLIKDCDFYTKKSPEPKLKTMVNTSQRVVKPVWDNAKRVNQQKISNNLKYPQARRTFVPSGVLTRTGLVNPVRPNGKRAVHTVSTARPISTARPFAPKLAQTGSAIRPIYPRMDNVRPRASYSPIKRSYYTKPAFRPKNLKQDVKTSRVKNMTTAGTRAVVNTGKGKMMSPKKKDLSYSRSLSNPESILHDHAVVDSGCSSHMTGNKAYLSNYKDYNRDFVAFGSDPKG